MNKFLLGIAMLSAVSGAQAQTKKIATADLLANRLPAHFRNEMPVVLKWLDDEKVILKQN